MRLAVGDAVGRWTLLNYEQGRKKPLKAATWSCRCSCGVTRVVAATSLLSGSSKSCGCLKAAITAVRSVVHGGRHSATYSSWRSMKSRCSNPKSTVFKYYGGRGISYATEWAEYQKFVQDMGERPSRLFSIERKDTNGDYCKENCVWATDLEQGRNKNDTHWLTAYGRKLATSEWSEVSGVRLQTLLSRLKRGMRPEDALTAPVRHAGSRATSKQTNFSITTQQRK